jgi:DNA-binding XRE family transcriptional regulator
VQSPWNNVLDVQGLHKDIRCRIHQVVSSCGQQEAARCLTITAPPGYGKTHLLACTRQRLEQDNSAVFIYVPPYSSENVSLEQHILRATLEALRLRSQRQSRLFSHAVQRTLVLTYDAMARARRLEELGVPREWLDWVFSGRHSIGNRSEAEQLPALQKALQNRSFINQAFQDFVRPIVSDAPGVQVDRDTFAAACLLTCGNEQQRWYATRWFENSPEPRVVWNSCHLDHPCSGLDKVRHALLTLSRLINQHFCLVFDQMEDTQVALNRLGHFDAYLEQMGLFIRPLSETPGYCLLFMFQTSSWIQFQGRAPRMLTDRMITEHGEQALAALDAASAAELICARMDHTVWANLPPNQKPQCDPLFPFSQSDILQMRHDAGLELRGFLRRAGERYNELLQVTSLPTHLDPAPSLTQIGNGPRSQPFVRLTPPIVLTGINPIEVLDHEPCLIVLSGQNFPDDVEVYFNQQQVEPVTCRPDQGQIEVTTQIERVLNVSYVEVDVRVQACNNPANSAAITLFVVGCEVPRPYHQHIDRQLLRQRRNDVRLTQTEVGMQLGRSQSYIAQLEGGRNQPSDEIFIALARLYRRPLAAFMRQPS